MSNNLDKARAKLEVFPSEYCGISVAPLLSGIDGAKEEIERVASDGGSEFDFRLIPKLHFHKPGNPDLMVEIKDIVQEGAFLEGAKLFNGGYFWEAHEAWEEVWRGRDGDAKSFVQGFVEAAAGCNFLKQSKRSNATYLLGKSLEKFRQFENLNVGFPLRQFVDDLGALQNALHAGADPRSSNGKTVVIPRITLAKTAVS
jgi:hypothetical protein